MSRAPLQQACLLAGLATSAVAAVLLVAGVMIPGFGVDVQFYGDFSFNFSAFLYIGLVFAGIIVASFYFKSPDVRIVSMREPREGTGITSIAWSRIVAGGLLLAVGVVSFAVFGLEFTDENQTGMWLFLGGPSLSIPAGFLPLTLGVVLVIAGLASMKNIHVHNDGNTITITESRALSSVISTIPAGDVQVAHLSNARTGLRLLWIPLFTFSIYLLLVDGISFLTNPFAFGTGPMAGTMYVLSATVQLVAVVLLMFGGNHVLSVVTSEQVYELNFTPAGRRAINIKDLLGPVTGTGTPAREYPTRNNYAGLVTGLAFVTVAVISRVFFTYASDMHRFILLVAGGAMIVEWVKRSMIRGAGVVQTTGDHVSSVRGPFRDQFLFSGEQVAGGSEPVTRLARLAPQDHLVLVAVAASTGFDMATSMMLKSPTLVVHAVTSVVIHVIVASSFLVLLLATYGIARTMLEKTFRGRRFQVDVKPPREPRSWQQVLRGALPVLIEIIIAFVAGLVGGILIAVF